MGSRETDYVSQTSACQALYVTVHKSSLIPLLHELMSPRHGKDYKINVWKFSEEDEISMSTVLPAEDLTSSRKQPWLLYDLSVNTLNFCSLALCRAQGAFKDVPKSDLTAVGDLGELLIAVPNAMATDAASHLAPAPS
jgi:hypothetical protein